MSASRALPVATGRMPIASWTCAKHFGAALASVVLLATTRLVAAETAPSPVDLTWDAPAECPDSTAVMSEVNRLVSSGAGARLAVEARVSREAEDRYTLSIRARGAARGVRSISAQSCESLARAAALLIALALDRGIAGTLEDDLLGTAGPEPSRGSTLGPEAKPAAPEPVAPTPAPQPGRRRARTSLSGGVLGERALLPPFALGGYVGVGVEGRSFAARLELAGLPEASARSPDRSDVEVDFSLVRAAAAGCWRGGLGPLVAASCAAVQVSTVRAVATGVDRSTPREATLTAVAPSLLLRWPRRTRVALEAMVEVSAPLSRPTFSVQHLGPVYRVHPAGYSGRLGLVAWLGTPTGEGTTPPLMRR